MTGHQTSACFMSRPPFYLTLHENLRHHVSVRPYKVAVVYEDESRTFKDVYEDACRIANALADRGIGQGDFGTGVIGHTSADVAWGVSGVAEGTLGTGVYGRASGEFGNAVLGEAQGAGAIGVHGIGTGANAWGGYFSAFNENSDLGLGGFVGRINSDPNFDNSSLSLLSNHDVMLQLDSDGNADGVFRILKSGGAEVCSVNENGP